MFGTVPTAHEQDVRIYKIQNLQSLINEKIFFVFKFPIPESLISICAQ